MTKNILKQYDSLRKEITDVSRRLQSTKDKLKRLEEEGTVSDTVSGGDGGIQHFKVTGFPMRDYTRYKSLLEMRTLRLKELQAQLADTQEKIEVYISEMDSSECRRIASFRYIDKMSWKNVAAHMGYQYTEDSCRMILDRYLKRHD